MWSQHGCYVSTNIQMFSEAAATGGVLLKKKKKSDVSQESTCVGVSF